MPILSSAPSDRGRFDRLRLIGLAACGTVLLLACASPPNRNQGPSGASASAAPLPVLKRDDVLWLDRVTFGLDSQTLADYRHEGREHFLDQQLEARGDDVPAPIAAQIAAMQISHLDLAERLADVQARNKAVNAVVDGDQKDQARKAINDDGNKLASEAIRRDLLRALYSSDQLREQMVWFWLNHFSVHQYKAQLRWLIADYEERAIRPHALGHFRDLVMATLTHPAMLQYLDNRDNAVGHVNENYARELMELHTLGVNSGYTQQDVQQLALILTGVGINLGPPPHFGPPGQALYLRRGVFEFNPRRHDFGRHVLFGREIEGQGFGEVEQAVTLIVRQPACAQFISHQIASYFVADEPPPRLVQAMAQTFQRTDGDIAAVLRTMLLSPDFSAALGGKFKDPMRYVVSAVRFAYDGRQIANTRPLLNWLNALGEAPYGRPTPDGYPLIELNWASPGQLSRRFEIARAIGSGSAGLFDPEDGTPATTTGFPQLSNRLYFEAVEPFLAANTRVALNRATTPQEWNTLLLASPDFNYE